MREDRKTRELISISKWKPGVWKDKEIAIARGIVMAADSSSYDHQIRAYFEEHWMHRDAPLPPIEL
jgi:hypothetical protein